MTEEFGRGEKRKEVGDKLTAGTSNRSKGQKKMRRIEKREAGQSASTSEEEDVVVEVAKNPVGTEKGKGGVKTVEDLDAEAVQKGQEAEREWKLRHNETCGDVAQNDDVIKEYERLSRELRRAPAEVQGEPALNEDREGEEEVIEICDDEEREEDIGADEGKGEGENADPASSLITLVLRGDGFEERVRAYKVCSCSSVDACGGVHDC